MTDHETTALRLQKWIDEHQCEDVAGGALDAQAEAEKQLFKIRERLEAALDQIVGEAIGGKHRG